MCVFKKVMVLSVLVGMLCGPLETFATPPPPPVVQERVETPAESALDGAETPPKSKSIDTEQASRVVSGLAQTGAGIVGGAVLGYLGALIGAGLCGSDAWEALGCGILGAGVGMGVGVPVSAWAAGEWLGWDGSLLATVGGFAIGVVLVSIAIETGGNEAADVLMPSAILILPASAAVGYQFSATWAKGAGVAAVPKMTSMPIVHFNF